MAIRCSQQSADAFKEQISDLSFSFRHLSKTMKKATDNTIPPMPAVPAIKGTENSDEAS